MVRKKGLRMWAWRERSECSNVEDIEKESGETKKRTTVFLKKIDNCMRIFLFKNKIHYLYG